MAEMNVVVRLVEILLCIPEASDSNLKMDTDYSD
jgi:hypothetical protein